MAEVIRISDEQNRFLQLNILELLVEVDRICRKNKIKYSLDGGTLLGAIRHKGFVPWDDDGDVVFTRKEYERFYQACKTDLNTELFFLQDYRTDKEYRWGYAKMRLLATEVVRKGHENLKFKNGVCIDIFVNDNVPDNKVLRRLYYWNNVVIRKILYSEMGRTNADSAILRMWYALVYRIIPKDTAFRIRNYWADKCNKKPTSLVSHLLFPYPKKKCRYGMPSECFEEYIDIEFEGMLFKGFKQYDKYLKLLYGNYMELPPIEKRKGQLNPVVFSIKDDTIEEIVERYNAENAKYIE